MGAIGRVTRAVRRRAERLSGEPQDEWARALRAERRAEHPRFTEAVLADADVTVRLRGDSVPRGSAAMEWFQVLRLSVVSDAFFAQVCYRGKAALQRRGVPVVPRLLHRLAMITGQVCIGDPVLVHPGVHIPHGQVVLDARTTVHSGVTLSPFTTLGRVSSRPGGPTIGAMAEIGTGAKVVGPVTVGKRAKVGANAVVVDDVPDDAVAVGVPARVLARDPAEG